MANVGDVLDQIAIKWKTFTDVERNALATAIAGTRQRENILTLFENYPKAIEYANIALDSAGTAEQKFQAYTSGTEASLKKLQATWESTVNEIGDSQLLNQSYQFLSNLLKGLSTDFGKAILKTTLFVSVLGLASTGINRVIRSIQTSRASIGGLRQSFGDLIAGIRLAREQGMNLNDTLRTVGYTEEQVAQMTGRLRTAISLATSVIVMGISYINEVIESRKRADKEANRQIIENAVEEINKYKEERDTLEEIQNKYAELQNKNLSKNEYREEARNIQNEINDLLGEEANRIDLINGKYSDQTIILNQLAADRAKSNLKALKQDTEVLKQQLGASVKDILEDYIYDFNWGSVAQWTATGAGTGAVATAGTGIGAIAGGLIGGGAGFLGSVGVELYKTLSDAEDIIASDLKIIYNNVENEQTEAIRKLGENQDLNLKQTREYVEKLRKAREDLIEGKDKIGQGFQQDLAVLNSAIAEYETRIENYSSALAEVYSSQAQIKLFEDIQKGLIDTQEEYDNYVNTLKQTEKDEEYLAVLLDLLVRRFPQYQKVIEDTKNSITFLDTYLEKLEQELNNISEIYSTLNSALQEYNSNNFISEKTFQELLKLKPQYLAYLIDENGQIRDNVEALKELVAIEYQRQAVQAASAFLDEAELLSSEEIIGNSKAKTLTYQTETQAMWALVAARIQDMKISKEAKQTLWNQSLEFYYAANKAIKGIGLSAQTSSQALKEQNTAIKNLFDFAKKTLEYEIDKLQEQNDELEEQTKQYDLVLGYINDYIDERIDALNKEKEALSKKNDEAERETKLQELQLKLAKAQQKNMRVYVRGQGWVWTYDEAASKEAQQEIDEFNTQNQTEAIEKLIDAWNEYKDSWGKASQAYDKEKQAEAFSKQTLINLGDIAKRNLSPVQQYTIAYMDLKDEIANNEEQIEALQKLGDSFAEAQEELEQNETLGTMTLEEQSKLRQMILDGDLEGFKEYVRQYNEEYSKLPYSSERFDESYAPVLDEEAPPFEPEFTNPTSAKLLQDRTARARVERAVNSLIQAEGDVIGHDDLDENINTASNTKRVVNEEVGELIKSTQTSNIADVVLGSGWDIKNQRKYWGVKIGKAWYEISEEAYNNLNYRKNQTKNGYYPNATVTAKGATGVPYLANLEGKYGTGTFLSFKSDDLKYGVNLYQPLTNFSSFASGTKSSPQGIANVDENGNELIIDPPSRGRYTFLRDGSGVLPHNLTERIFDMASNPNRFVERVIGKNSILTNKSSNTVLNISNVSLPSVKNGNDFVKELQIIANNR